MVRVVAVSAILGFVAIMGVSAARAAEPDQLGFLVVEPATGDLTTTIDIATSGECTRGQVFALKLDGPNLDGTDRGNLIGATKISTIGPESYPGHYVVPLSTNLATYLATAAPGQRIKGDYALTFACRDTLSTADLQVFTATISIDGKGRYVAQGESAMPIDELIEGYVAGSAGFAYGDPAPPDPAEVAEYEAEQAATEAQPGDPFPWRVVLIVAGVLLIGSAGYAWWRNRGKADDVEVAAEDASAGSAR